MSEIVRFEDFTAVVVVVMMMAIMFWALAPCGFVGACQSFGATYCLHLRGSSDDAGT
jgi:cytosine/uracil/thiamine/allantoin permease